MAAPRATLQDLQRYLKTQLESDHITVRLYNQGDYVAAVVVNVQATGDRYVGGFSHIKEKLAKLLGTPTFHMHDDYTPRHATERSIYLTPYHVNVLAQKIAGSRQVG